MLGLIMSFVLPAQAEGVATPEDIDGLLQKMSAAEQRLKDSVYLFHQSERIQGKQQPKQLIRMFYRRPHQVFLHWEEGGAHAGRQIIYKKGWNGGKLKVTQGKWVPNLDLNPYSKLVMRSSRHSVADAGFPNIINMILTNTEKVKERPELQSGFTDLGTQNVQGAQARCYRTELRKDLDASLYGYKIEICINTQNHLPARVKTWDKIAGSLVVVEDYKFSDVKVNTGLEDIVFDPKNPDYNF